MSRSVPGYRSVTGMAPDGEGSWDFLVGIAKLQDLERRGPIAKFYDARSVPEILGRPWAVFHGLEREDCEDAYCYCGIPEHRWLSSTVQVPPPPGMTLLVYVFTDHRGHIVTDWGWRQTHPDRNGCPIDYESAFGRQVWPTT